MTSLPAALDPLRDEPVWVAWDYEGGRKVPKSPHGGNARSNDPSTWGTYDEAVTAAGRGGLSGVGIMLSGGYIGFDLDGAASDGEIEPWARDIIDEMGSYAEVSPSGTGVHVIAWADPEEVGPVGRADHAAGIEAYNHGRYFTVTGEQVGSSPIADVTGKVASFLASHFTTESPEDVVRRRVGALASDQARRFANRTMERNCARDGIRYARVPSGAETCGFCLMLASRGFVYHSDKKAGSDGHYHRDCDCVIMPGFDGLEVEGYDPDQLYASYLDAVETLGGVTDASSVARELERRDPEWVRHGTACSVTRQRGAKPWRKETEVADALTAHGFNVEFVREPKDARVFDAYLNGLSFEFKVPEAYNAKTVKNQFKKAVGKGTGRLLISNWENGADPGEMLSDIESIMSSDDFSEIREVLFVAREGALRRLLRT